MFEDLICKNLFHNKSRSHFSVVVLHVFNLGVEKNNITIIVKMFVRKL